MRKKRRKSSPARRKTTTARRHTHTHGGHAKNKRH